jgi:hypothetical protein
MLAPSPQGRTIPCPRRLTRATTGSCFWKREAFPAPRGPHRCDGRSSLAPTRVAVPVPVLAPVASSQMLAPAAESVTAPPRVIGSAGGRGVLDAPPERVEDR